MGVFRNIILSGIRGCFLDWGCSNISGCLNWSDNRSYMDE